MSRTFIPGLRSTRSRNSFVVVSPPTLTQVFPNISSYLVMPFLTQWWWAENCYISGWDTNLLYWFPSRKFWWFFEFSSNLIMFAAGIARVLQWGSAKLNFTQQTREDVAGDYFIIWDIRTVLLTWLKQEISGKSRESSVLMSGGGGDTRLGGYINSVCSKWSSLNQFTHLQYKKYFFILEHLCKESFQIL